MQKKVMALLRGLLAPILRPVIVTDADLRRYAFRVTLTCIPIALSLDVISQLVFFTDWATAFRSWALTVVVASLTAVPIAYVVGRSQRELYKAKRELEGLSRSDPLTGLPNRRAIMELAEDETLALLLVIVDVDRFKAINDTHGHRVGDGVLHTVAQLLAADLHEAELVGRLGGEEFAILARSEASSPVLRALEAFRARIAALPLLTEGVAITVTISAGAAVRQPGEPFAQLYSEADEALYQAKSWGRNRIVLAPHLREAQAERESANSQRDVA